ncbi:hypothetical protein [Streptomyces sp. NPDC095817]|uniref:hypothetical protein n=1 Tax=Streptomyces sp. NPDC095817 TaxID=3155082 RepID=UPI0033186886
MYIAAVILSVLLALLSLAAGAPKVQFKGDVPDGLVAKDLSSAQVRRIGLGEIAAAVGLAVLLLAAIGYHVKWGEYGNTATRGAAMAPVLFFLVAVATAATLAASH